MMPNWLDDAIEAVTDFVTKTDGATESSAPTPEATGSLPDPGPDRREPVHGLLEANGGRVWQQDVVAELDCSAPSVSRLLSEMEAEDEITRYWKRGQKVVALPALGPDGEAGASNRQRRRAT